ncbi:MAG: hypothetical protein JSW26_15525 [Desulfobacterales bacterium]|nr:MAG: hypothetical protein JSW26_15525 [Desulfobacterales bacterium]
MKSSSYSTVKSLIVVAIASLLGPALVQFALASPVGTNFTAVLDIPVLVQPGDQPKYEYHFSDSILFDSAPGILPNDEGPPDAGDNTDGKDFWVTETYSQDAAGGGEHLSILISSGDGTQLTVNEIDQGQVAALGIFDLYWAGSSAGVSVIDFVLAPSFDGGLTFEPFDSSDFVGDPEIFGTGTVDDPLGFYFEIFGDSLLLPIEPSALTATDLKLDFTVQPVPISGSLWLLLSGLIGLIGLKSGCRRRPDR